MKNKKVKKNEKQIHSVFSNVFYLLKDIYASTKILFVLMVIKVICVIITPMFGIYLPKIAVDLVTQKADVQTIFMTLGLFVLVMLCVDILQNVSGSSRQLLYSGKTSAGIT